MRDLSRAREEMKRVEIPLKQRLLAFLLRQDKRYRAGKSKWTHEFFRWLWDVKMDLAVQELILEEYVDAVKQAEERVRALNKELERALEGWSLRPVVESLMVLRGVRIGESVVMRATLSLTTILVTHALFGSEWLQWRSPDRTGVASAPAPSSWPRSLTKSWRVEVGTGHSTPVVQGERVYQLSRRGEREVVRAPDTRPPSHSGTCRRWSPRPTRTSFP